GPELLPGDYNADGFIDQNDYADWIAAFGQSVAVPGSGADGNGDGFVDSADYTIWRDNFHAGSATSVAAAVPEPSTGSLAWIASTVLAIWMAENYIRPKRCRALAFDGVP